MTKKTKTKALPPVATIDFETDPFQRGLSPRVFCGAIATETGTYSEWGTQEQVVKAVVGWCVGWAATQVVPKKSKKARPVVPLIYAHNGGKFDFFYIIRELLTTWRAEYIKCLVIGSRIVRIETPVCEFRDSYALLPRPLKSLGAKSDMDMRCLHVDRRDAHKDAIIKYCENDTIVLRRAILRWLEAQGDSLTLAGAAYKCLKATVTGDVPKGDENHDGLFRPYYQGGRNQYWGLGKIAPKGGLKLVDLNSAYPAAMCHDHATGTAWIGVECVDIDGNHRDAKDIMDEVPASHFQQAFWDVECYSKGAFPMRAKDRGTEAWVENDWQGDKARYICGEESVVYPHSVGRYQVTGWELKAALELGIVSNLVIHEVKVPMALANFRAYVTHWYGIKETTKCPHERLAAKLMLNSAYGKMALNPENHEEFRIKLLKDLDPDVDLINGWGMGVEDEERGIVFVRRKLWGMEAVAERREEAHAMGVEMDEPEYENVATAASITGYVRAQMLRALHACKGVVYCDTDSIIAQDVSSLKIGTGLGEWKLEAEITELYMAARKLYTAKLIDGTWKKASKGVNLNPETIKKIATVPKYIHPYNFPAPTWSPKLSERFITRKISCSKDSKKV